MMMMMMIFFLSSSCRFVEEGGERETIKFRNFCCRFLPSERERARKLMKRARFNKVFVHSLFIGFSKNLMMILMMMISP